MHGDVQDIGQHRKPESRPRAAADDVRLRDHKSGVGKHVPAIRKREGNAFEHALHDRVTIGGVAEPIEHAAHVRIIVRGTLAGEVGQEADRRRSLRAQPERRQQVSLGRPEQSRDPGQAGCGREDRAGLDPSGGDGVTERVHDPLRIRRDCLGRHQQCAGGSERNEG